MLDTLDRTDHWRRVARRVSACVVAGTLSCGACASAPDGTVQRLPLTGIVVESHAGRGAIVIAHDAIENHMPAMTMPMTTSGPAPVMSPGDRISATLVIDRDVSRLEHITLVAHASGPVLPSLPRLPLPAPGAHMPTFQLENQRGEQLTLAGFAGDAVLITFVYTRCPLPEFCPRTMSQFAAVRKALKATPDVWNRVRLVAITLDPAFDTPSRLDEYGRTVIRGTEPFERWDLATGRSDEIERVATFLGVASAMAGGGLIHASSTAVIAPDGTLAHVFPSNDWRADDVVAELKRALRYVTP